jgi:adenylate kinase
MRLVMLGAPGAGKGTQAAKISEKYGIPHVSTGDILRSEIKKETEYGIKAREYVESGQLVPDELVFDIIENFIKSDTAKKGFLLDGFPRNIAQAERFTGMLERAGIDLDKVINIVVDNEEIIRRLSLRRICKDCQQIGIFDETQGDVCGKCGGTLIIRKDDQEDVIRHRLKVYDSQTHPLVEYYREKGKIIDIEGTGTLEEVTERIMESL